jgi:hypothetical protein
VDTVTVKAFVKMSEEGAMYILAKPVMEPPADRVLILLYNVIFVAEVVGCLHRNYLQDSADTGAYKILLTSVSALTEEGLLSELRISNPPYRLFHSR